MTPWPEEVYTFNRGDRVLHIPTGMIGVIKTARYNCFYQLLWTVQFDDGTEREIITDNLRKIA